MLESDATNELIPVDGYVGQYTSVAVDGKYPSINPTNGLYACYIHYT